MGIIDFMSSKNPTTKKQIAQEFLRLTEEGKAEEAFELYVAKDFKHHNSRLKGDCDSLIVAMTKTAERFPELVSKRYAALEDGNLVAVHSHIKPLPKSKDGGLTYIHIFRFSRNRIVELWDFGQALPANTVNENGAF